MKDTIGQISLNRNPKNRPLKNRRTQSKNFYAYASGASLRPDMYAFGNIKITGGSFSISYESDNPENTLTSDGLLGLGNTDDYKPGSFDDMKEDPSKMVEFFKTKNAFKKDSVAKSNATYDVTRRNGVITNQKTKTNDFIKASVGVAVSEISKASVIVTSEYESFDVKDAFKDEHSSIGNNKFYINNKNHYNSGNIKPFSEKDNITYNSIINTETSQNEYYKSYKSYANHGFLYKSKKPDSIAFGGLKR